MGADAGLGGRLRSIWTRAHTGTARPPPAHHQQHHGGHRGGDWVASGGGGGGTPGSSQQLPPGDGGGGAGGGGGGAFPPGSPSKLAAAAPSAALLAARQPGLVGRLDREVLVNALACTGASMADPLMSFTDTFFAGRLGTAALAALAANTALYGVLYFLCFTALAVLCTRSMAAASSRGDAEACGRGFLQALAASLAVSAALMALLLCAPGPLLRLFAHGGADVMPLAKTYCMIRALALPAALAMNVCQAAFRSMLDLATPFAVVMAANAANYALDRALMLGAGWGMAGCGLASIASQYIGAGLFGLIIFRRRHKFGIPQALAGAAERYARQLQAADGGPFASASGGGAWYADGDRRGAPARWWLLRRWRPRQDAAGHEAEAEASPRSSGELSVPPLATERGQSGSYRITLGSPRRLAAAAAAAAATRASAAAPAGAGAMAPREPSGSHRITLGNESQGGAGRREPGASQARGQGGLVHRSSSLAEQPWERHTGGGGAHQHQHQHQHLSSEVAAAAAAAAAAAGIGGDYAADGGATLVSRRVSAGAGDCAERAPAQPHLQPKRSSPRLPGVRLQRGATPHGSAPGSPSRPAGLASLIAGALGLGGRAARSGQASGAGGPPPTKAATARGAAAHGPLPAPLSGGSGSGGAGGGGGGGDADGGASSPGLARLNSAGSDSKLPRAPPPPPRGAAARLALLLRTLDWRPFATRFAGMMVRGALILSTYTSAAAVAGRAGTAALAAHQVTQQQQQLQMSFCWAFLHVAQSMCAVVQSAPGGGPRAARRLARRIVFWAAAAAVSLAALTYSHSSWLSRGFTRDPLVLALAGRAALPACVMLGLAWNNALEGCLLAAEEQRFVVSVYPLAAAVALVQLGATVLRVDPGRAGAPWALAGVWWALAWYYAVLLGGFAWRFLWLARRRRA